MKTTCDHNEGDKVKKEGDKPSTSSIVKRKHLFPQKTNLMLSDMNCPVTLALAPSHLTRGGVNLSYGITRTCLIFTFKSKNLLIEKCTYNLNE